MNADDFYNFLQDPELTEFIEQAKVSDDILDVIKLTENQHSDMLAWCLTPDEGHGLGDSVIKDFLEAAFHASERSTYDNKKFFQKWTPGRIRVAGFGAAFVTREFAITVDEADSDNKRPGRLDLFLVDPQNKLLIAIENKVGAKLTKDQLTRYQTAVNREIGGRPIFSDYEFAYIVLDRELEWYSEEDLEQYGTRWIMLSYSWLEASARRARLHVARNNQAAQLLVSYCQKQTDWESPSELRLSELASELAERHPSVIRGLLDLRGRKLPDWTRRSLDGHDGELMLFRAQHLRLCNLLVRSRGIASLQNKIRKTLLLQEDDLVHGRIWLEFVTPAINALTASDKVWALSINLFRPSGGDDEKPRYTLRVIWRNASLDQAFGNGDDLRGKLEGVLPGVKRFQSAAIRRIVISRNLDAPQALAGAVDMAEKLTSILVSAGVIAR